MTRYDIYTIAGPNSDACTGSSPDFCPNGNSGDDGPATTALMNGPGNATVDAAGDVYVTDTGNNRVREVPAANGTQWGQAMTANDIYNVAGSAAGNSGNSGDGGLATAALFSNVQNVSLDSAGDMYVTDGSNDRLREVTSATPATIAPAPLQASALYPAPGGITITQPGGAQVTFYAQSGGQCSWPYVVAGQYCALAQDVGASLTYSSSPPTWTFTSQPGTTFTYNSSGLLTGESDAAGDTLSVTYGVAHGSGNCPSSAAWCQVISSASGRTLTLGYNNASPVNQITSVTDPLGRQWSYTYSGSDLATVTDPMSNVTSYGYDSSNANPVLANDLLTITRPNGQVGGPDAGAHTIIGWDSTGRVISVTDPMGFQTSYDWSAISSSTGSGFITVNDPDGNKTVYYYRQGTLAAQSTWTGTSLASEQDFAPDQADASGDNSAGTQLDTATADGNGNITTISYDSNSQTGLTNGNPITTTAPDGIGNQVAVTTQQSTSLDLPDCTQAVIASSTCSSSPGPSPVAPGGVITPPSSAPPQGVTWTLYDTHGNELYSTTGVYEPGSNTAAYSQTTYQLFNGNSVTLNGNNITCSASPPSPSLPCATINADGVVTQLGYDTQGDLTSSSTPDGNAGNELATTTYGYDGDGEQTSMTSPDGNLSGANAGNYTTITTWNANSEKTEVAQGDGTGHTVTPRTTLYGYDADGNQATVQDARSYTTTTTYNADDQATLVTDPDSNATLTCYDGAGNVTQNVPPTGVAASSLTSSSCPASYPSGYGDRLASDATTYTFNGLGQQTQMTTPAPAGQSGSETTSYSYDANGNLTQTTAPPATNGGSNQVTVDTYTDTGQLATETTGYGTSVAATVSYCYDANGNKTSVVYADGNASGVAACETSSPWVVNSSSYPTQASRQTTYSYDSANELVSTTAPATAAAPSGATTTSTYDAAGNALTRTDPNAVTTTWTYTPLNKPATVSYSGSSAHSVSYGYDASGNKTAMTDATGSSSDVYDSFGELTSATNGASQVTGYGYNADGQVSSVTYPLPSNTWSTTPTVNYTYDNADLLTKVTDFNGNAITIGNTADGLQSSVSLGSSGDNIATTYDNTDAPSAIALKNSTSTLLQFNYSDSPAGMVVSECDATSCSTPTVSYAYDAKGRVTSMTPAGGAATNYSFDASSNLTTLPTGAGTTYDNAGELTSSTVPGTTTSYTYNADGQQLTAKQGATTVSSGSWNGAGQLTAYTDPSASMTAATYDGDGMRASATTGSVSQQFIWGTVSGIPQLLMDSGNAYIYCSGLAPVEQVSLATGTVTYLVTDSLGSVRGTVNASGVLTGTTSYDAWGNPAASGGLTATTPFGYASGYTDPTGLIYLMSRYCNPVIGQFVSLDTLVSATLEPYIYANGDPVKVKDPTGSMYEVPLSKSCVNQRWCVWGRRNCNSQNWCNVNWWMTFEWQWTTMWVAALQWDLTIDVFHHVYHGGYSHGEFGSYWFHGEWGHPTRTRQRGEYSSWFGSTSHLGPHSWITLDFSSPVTLPNGNAGVWGGTITYY